MNKFEAILLYSPELSNTVIDSEDKNFTKNIENSDGKIISTENWGLRDLSYNINNVKKSFHIYKEVSQIYTVYTPGLFAYLY